MLFTKQTPLNISVCSSCQGAGVFDWHKCPKCSGHGVGFFKRQKLLYWGFPLTRYRLALARARAIFNRVRVATFIILGLNFWFWLGWGVSNSKEMASGLIKINSYQFFTLITSKGNGVLLFAGVVCFLYVFYRYVTEHRVHIAVEHFDYNHPVAASDPGQEIDLSHTKVARRARIDISKTFTEEALRALGAAYFLAVKNSDSAVTARHLFYALLNFNRISNVFVRLGILGKTIQSKLGLLLKNEKPAITTPTIAPDFWQALFGAYELAYEAHQDYVGVTDLVVAAVRQTPDVQDVLYDFNINEHKLANAVEWARVRERLYRQYKKFRHAAGQRSTTGMDKAMTALATPYLNHFSDDLTIAAQFGHLEPCIAREKEIDEVMRVIEGGQSNVILVGESGVGKKNIVEGIAQKMVEDDVPKRIQDKRLVRLSIPALLSGTTPAGAVERLLRITHEIARARNIVLFVHNVHELIGVSSGAEKTSLDVAGAFVEALSSDRFITIATTSTEQYTQSMSGTTLTSVFTKIEVPEMDENQSIQVLEAKVGQLEYKNQVFFAYEAIEKAVQLSHRFLHDLTLPGSALEIVTEAATLVRNSKGANALVSAEDVAKVVAEKTHIPVTSVSSDETSKLLRLEEEMHKRVIGQDEAVDLVANALRRARAEIRSQSRPIANFLFLGPTGVGKTELAKTIAEVYFGGENKIVRLDMSEYQDKTSIYRLLGAPGEKGTGILTEAIRHNPFTLLLLDEIEKADKDILNLFLQVMDDGRLTDSTGKVVDFTNVILIATSNAGTAFVSEQIRTGVKTDLIKDRLLHGELGQYFRPEFLNRFDGIVLFKPLTREDIKKVASLMLKSLAKDLDVKGVGLEVTDGALEFLADVGFDPEFGARPMRRAVQEKIENKLAEFILSGQLKRKNVVVIGDGGVISVK